MNAKIMMRDKLPGFLALTILAVGCAPNVQTNNQNGGASSNTEIVNANDNGKSAVASNSTTPAVQTAEVPVYTDATVAVEEGKKFFKTDEDEKAVKAFEQAVKLDPALPEAQFQLALAYDAVENQEDAEKTYNAAIKAYLKFLAKNPKDAAAHFNLGHSYNKINEDEKAQKAVQQAIKLKPDDTDYHLELGNILIKLARYSEAVKSLKKSLELDPENSRAEAALERAESGDIRVKTAQAKSKESKEVKPGSPKISVNANKTSKNANSPVSVSPGAAPANTNQ